MATPSAFKEEWIMGPKSTNFYTRRYLSTAEDSSSTPIAHIVFIHGFIEHIARYEHVFPQYAAKGISVFCYDQRGFGRTATDKEHKSSTSVYGQTSWDAQMDDIEFFLKQERESLGTSVPMFLMGQSMGGGEVLGYVTAPPTPKSSLKVLSGVIATSPLIRQAKPQPALKVKIGHMLASLMPNFKIEAPVDAKSLSHDPKVAEKYLADPMCAPYGCLKGVGDMLTQGIAMAETYYKNWPETLPLMIVHGDADATTSYAASKKFIEDIKAKDKHLATYPGGYHELVNEPDGVCEKMIAECTAWISERAKQGSDGSKL